MALCEELGLGLAVVTLVGRVGFSDDRGFWVVLVGLFVVDDGFFVVTDDDAGLVAGFRVGLLVVVLLGLLVTVEGADEVAAVLFRV